MSQKMLNCERSSDGKNLPDDALETAVLQKPEKLVDFYLKYLARFFTFSTLSCHHKRIEIETKTHRLHLSVRICPPPSEGTNMITKYDQYNDQFK